MTVAELLARISSAELTEWMAFAQLEPFHTETQYLGPAITTAMIANVNRKKGSKASKVEDFIPDFSRPKQSTEAMINIARMYTALNQSEDEK
jgi:hypothetical protein